MAGLSVDDSDCPQRAEFKVVVARFAHERFGQEAPVDAEWIAGRAIGLLVLAGMSIVATRAEVDSTTDRRPQRGT